MNRRAFFEVFAVTVAAYVCLVLLLSILTISSLLGRPAVLLLDLVLVPIDLVWFPTRSTSIVEGCIVVFADSLIWGFGVASVIAVRRARAKRRATVQSVEELQ